MSRRAEGGYVSGGGEPRLPREEEQGAGWLYREGILTLGRGVS